MVTIIISLNDVRYQSIRKRFEAIWALIAVIWDLSAISAQNHSVLANDGHRAMQWSLKTLSDF